MGALIRLVPSILLLVATPARADEVGRWRPYVEQASTRFGIPSSWIERVIRAESRGLTTLNGRPIRSRAGAMGLMQLMPATWRDMRSRLSLGNDPDDPRDNILAGTFFLRLMYDRYGYPGLFSAYNAGSGRYAEHLATGRALPGETIAYLGQVASIRQDAPVEPAGPPRETLFVIQRGTLPHDEPAGSMATPAPLFVVRRDVD
jgi:soluble lytic murein transglycosylase-like protein